MISANLQQWIQHPETLNKDTLYELRTLVTRYPYFQSLRLLYLKNLYLLHDISFGAELRKAILYVADRRKLFYLIEGERYILKPRKKNMPSEAEVLEEEPGLDRTLSLIDAFWPLCLKRFPGRQVWTIQRIILLICYRKMKKIPLRNSRRFRNFVGMN